MQTPTPLLSDPPKVNRKKDVHPGDLVFLWSLRIPALILLGTLLAIGYFLFQGSQISIHKFGWKFLTSTSWDPVKHNYGALPMIFGTLVTSGVAVLLATPLSVGVALFLNEIAPKKIAKTIGFLIEMLAAIPSVVYGLWGIFVLTPWLRKTVEPFLSKTLGFFPFFQGPPYGVGILAAALILAIMITPTISSISREIMRTIPRAQKEAAFALGATRWEMIRLSILPASKMGIFGATILGLGRALGETMAVTMVIGNRPELTTSFFDPAQTMASLLANEYAEATHEIHLSALVEIGLILFLITFLVNAFARLILPRSK